MRCFEQIKFNLCGMNLPVTIIGVGTGFSFDFDGPSHHAVSDIALMRTLPEIEIINISTENIAQRAAWHSYNSDKPTLLRLDKGTWPELHSNTLEFEGYSILKQGVDICVISTGIMIHRIINIANLLAKKGVNISVIECYRLKPVDHNNLLKHISSMKQILTVEESCTHGSLGTIFSELLTQYKLSCELTILGIKDEQTFLYGSRDWLHEHYKISESSLMEFIEKKLVNV